MLTSASNDSGHHLLVVAVGKQPGFAQTVAGALGDLTSGSGRALHAADRDQPQAIGEQSPAYSKALRRARRYLDLALPRADISLITAASLQRAGELAAATATGRPGRTSLALLLVDAEGLDASPAALDRSLDRALDRLIAALPAGVEAEISPYATVVYQPAHDELVQVGRRYTLRHRRPDQPWLVGADVICAFTDYVQLRHSSLAGHLATGKGTRTLAGALHHFLHRQAPAAWGLHYYTGSVVSGLINDLEQLARANGNPVLRGPSEHSLACGALARWQLDRAPFLITVTSGMVDEFRGVLSNLRQARAQGFIVCGDSHAGRWFPFQGTVHRREDSREVLRARGVPTVYLDDPKRLAAGLSEAFNAYCAGDGPVVLLCTPDVLDATDPLPTDPLPTDPLPGEPTTRAPAPGHATPAVVTPSVVTVNQNALDAIMPILNQQPARLLWQCGHLTDEESQLVHQLARDTGAALADTLARPGSVARFHHGQIVPEYLGTLGLYGYSARVHEYLHHDGRLRPRDEQCLFFLKSRIGEIATPFSERTLDRSLRVVQVTDNPHDVAPFADHPVVSDLAPLLRAVRARLDVDPQVLSFRQAAIAATRDSAGDVVGDLPVQPMSSNYFFARLAATLQRLITTTGYSYTGVFDVGRGGISAVRNLPRTGPGFSGWYGRALMGDALQAVPTLAVTRPGNLLAFIGDGAAALVPDIVPTLVQQICLGDARLDGNVSIFQLIDGGHSLIRTYREARQASTAGYQSTLLSLVDEDWRRSFGPVDVMHRRLVNFDPVVLSHELQDRGAINLYSVLLSHNNEGDGLSLLASLGWQRDQLLARGTLRPATTAGRAR